MTYTLDKIPLSYYGATPSLNGQAHSLHNAFDLPRRVGTTEHNWGTSIEPFVDEEDIELDGRNLVLHVSIKKDLLQAFLDACVDCTEIGTPYDTFEVVCKDEIKVDTFDDWCRVSVPFYQNEFRLKTLSRTPSGGGPFLLDGYSMVVDFKTNISAINGIRDTARRIEVQTTEFYDRTSFRSTRSIDLAGAITGYNIADFYDNVTQLQVLMMLPGLRELSLRNNDFFVYFKDGMTVEMVSDNIAIFKMKATVI